MTLLLFLAALLASMSSLDRSWSPSEQGWKRGDGLESPLSFPRAFFLFLYFSPRLSSILSFLTERNIFSFLPHSGRWGKKKRERKERKEEKSSIDIVEFPKLNSNNV
mgnify:CR=1 FL=1